MLTEEIEDVERISPQDLYDRYRDVLKTIIESVGLKEVANRTGIDPSKLRTFLSNTNDDLTIDHAATILSLDADAPDEDIIRAELEDRLLLGMTNAVLDVDTVAASIDLDLSGKEVQQKIEGRAPMSIEEYAHIYHLISRRKW